MAKPSDNSKTQTKLPAVRNNGKTNNKKSDSVSGKSSNGKSNGKSSGKKEKSLEDLLKDGIRDIYSAETQMLNALRELASAAYDEDLADAFSKHADQTKRQVERLEKVFSRLDIETDQVSVCVAMQGLIQEGKQIIEDYPESPVRDSALIIAAQKAEHYEIAVYGSLCELCDVLGYHRIGEILGRSLDEEETTDKDLSDIARYINDEACEMSERENGKQYEFSRN